MLPFQCEGVPTPLGGAFICTAPYESQKSDELGEIQATGTVTSPVPKSRVAGYHSSAADWVDEVLGTTCVLSDAMACAWTGVAVHTRTPRSPAAIPHQCAGRERPRRNLCISPPACPKRQQWL